MSNPNKLVGNDRLATPTVSDSPSETEHISKIPTSQEIIGLNARCEKETMKEVKFFIHSYEEFMNCTNEKLQSVISALNAANIERYNEVKIQYPDFMWQPPQIEISTLVTLIQRAYPAQVVEYTLGQKKSSLENAVKPKEEEPAGLFPPTKPKVNNVYNENFRDFNEEQLINEVNNDDIGSYQLPNRNGHDYRPRSRSPEMNSQKETGMMQQTEEVGMIAMQAGQTTIIIII